MTVLHHTHISLVCIVTLQAPTVLTQAEAEEERIGTALFVIPSSLLATQLNFILTGLFFKLI